MPHLLPATPVALIRVRAITGFATLVQRHGGDTNALLQKCGLDPSVLTKPEHAIPLRAVALLLDHAARELQVPDFGLQLAALQDISVIGVAALIVKNSDTIAEAVQGLARNLPYNNPAARIFLEEDVRPGYVCLRYEIAVEDAPPFRHGIELVFSIMYQFMRLTTNTPTSDWQVHFRHTQGLSPAKYRKYFQCPVVLGYPLDAMSFPARLLEMPINQADPILRATAERYLQSVERRNPLDMARQVQEVVAQQLVNGGGTIARVSKLMGMHTRTLQRRLEAQGVYFEDVVDAVRRQRAAEHLGYVAIPLAQVAQLAGYSGQNAFTRACKRWFGTTPQQYRAQYLLGGKKPDGS